MGKLIPVILAVVGLGGGVAAGLALRPEPDLRDLAATGDIQCAPGETPVTAEVHGDDHGDAQTENELNEFVKFSNQFIIPVMGDDRVENMVVLSLSLEVTAGSMEAIYAREPKLRDAFLQVLFNHANAGGFDGNFVDTVTLKHLRSALLEAADKQVGDLAVDVLIVDLIKQSV